MCDLLRLEACDDFERLDAQWAGDGGDSGYDLVEVGHLDVGEGDHAQVLNKTGKAVSFLPAYAGAYLYTQGHK